MPIDIEQLTTLADPYPAHAALRERGVHVLADGRWIVATANDVEHVLRTPAALIGFSATDRAGAIQSRMARFTDGDAHAERRTVGTHALSELDPVVLRSRATNVTAAILAEGGTVDIVARIARAVPVGVLASALGEQRTSTVDAVEAAIELALALAPPRGRSRGDAEAPLRRICSVTDPNVPLTDDHINTAALLFQAVDATAGLIGNSVVSADRFGSNMEATSIEFVREVSRFDPAVHFTIRQAADPIDVGSQQIPAGATIVVDLAAAGRDPDRWSDPDRFRTTRRGTSYAFGEGAHGCPGKDHALALAAGVLTALVASGGHLTNSDIAYEPRFNLRIPASLEWEL